MTQLNNQVYLSSVLKSVREAGKSGKLDNTILESIYIYNYYIDNPNILKEVYKDNYNEILNKLKDCIRELRYRFPDVICNYSIIVPEDSSFIPEEVNTPPVIDNNSAISNEIRYPFSFRDFTLNYRDKENDSWNGLKINGYTSRNGHLEYNNTRINIFPFIIDSIMDSNKLTYTRKNNTDIGLDEIYFQVSDLNINSLYSDEKTFTIYVEELKNLPPTINDITITAENRVETIITLDMFKSMVPPPYNDPENDLIDAVRIDRISPANKGIFQLNGTNIIPGQIITRDQLNSGNLKHIAPDIDSINSDSVDFSVRDQGSLIWVT